MTDTPPPRRAGSRKTLGFLVGLLILVAAVAVAYFADGGSAGRGFAPPVSAASSAAGSPAPVANPAEPATPAGRPAQAN